jgi:ATP-binding protein involved in chromosome partitioning
MPRKEFLCSSEAINVPVLGIIENMAYFTPESYLTISITFGKKEQNLAEDLEVHSGGIPIVQSIREAGVVVLQRCKLWRTFR